MTNTDFSPIVLTLKIFMNAVRATTPGKERRTDRQTGSTQRDLAQVKQNILPHKNALFQTKAVSPISHPTDIQLSVMEIYMCKVCISNHSTTDLTASNNWVKLILRPILGVAKNGHMALITCFSNKIRPQLNDCGTNSNIPLRLSSSAIKR